MSEGRKTVEDYFARILLVEDEDVGARFVTRYLERHGYIIVGRAKSADEAINLAGEHRPDLVLMDIKLEGTMDGIDAARVIQEKYEIPVLYLTAHADDRTLHRAMATKPYGYVIKPFQSREVHAAIQMAVIQHDLQGALKKTTNDIEILMRQQRRVLDMFRSTAQTMKNTMGSLSGFFNMVERRRDNPEGLRELLDDSSMHILNDQMALSYQLIESILDFSRPQATKVERLDIGEQISKSVNLFSMSKSGRGIEIKSRFDTDAKYQLYAREIDLQSVMGNLLNNAGDEVLAHLDKWLHHPEFDPEKTEDMSIWIDIEEKDDMLQIQVGNIGRQIDEDDRDSIFRKGMTDKSEGSGLGLFECKKVIEDLGGKIWSENFEDKGTVLKFTVPLEY